MKKDIANRITLTSVLGLSVLAVAFGFLLTLNTQKVSASIPEWDAGRIIDDYVFTNKDTMNPVQIQAFLNEKVPNCDTWGSRPSEFGGGTRLQWAQARGYSAPFTCLRDYTESGHTAAQIIYDVSQEFAINPQVLLVLLQKEQSLVTDTWPISTQYKTATGYGCPDTAPCDSQYFGLTNQLRWAARMFSAIINNSPTWYTPYTIGSNYVRYNPDASCGGTVINIQNRATQALYNYTPYQPNPGALSAGWGTAHCGAYGNRNFYLYFTSWFGPTQSNDTKNPHPSGTLVNVDNRIYLIGNGMLHYIANSSIFESYDYRWGDIKPATTGDRQLPIAWGVDTIKPGVLYKSRDSGIYITVYENGKWVKQQMSYDSFIKLGYSWDQVRIVPKSDMPAETSSSIYFNDWHPDGTLIKNQFGVYLIDHQTRRYVLPAVFSSHGWRWGDIVNETPADAARMPYGERTLLRNGSLIADTANIYVVEVPPTGLEIKRPIGPWRCYSSVFRYTTNEVILTQPHEIPVDTGSLVSC